MAVDNVDAGLQNQLTDASDLWSDMIIFSCVTPSKLSNFLHTTSAFDRFFSFG